MRVLHWSPIAAAALLLIPGPVPARNVVMPGMRAATPNLQHQAAPRAVHHAVGLGAMLTTQDGGQIFGFDINQNGDDGVLASAQTISSGGEERVSMETFDQNTGKITKVFARHTGKRHEYGMNGIFAGDVALITHYVTPKGTIFPVRHFEIMNPVTAGKFTGKWTPPIPDIAIEQSAENQTTTTSLFYAIELKNQDVPDLIVSHIAANTSKVIHLDPEFFSLNNSTVIGQYSAKNEAVVASSPDGGAVGGAAPINLLVNLNTGKTKQFQGYNNGFFHAGYVTGMAVDPNTGIEATATELNAQVEFYNTNTLSKVTFAQLPCTGDTDQGASAAGIAVDPLNKLFLVTEQLYCGGSQGSAIIVYDESGNLVETITGFHFFIAEPPPVLNPSKRMGWTFGPGFSNLQQFFY